MKGCLRPGRNAFKWRAWLEDRLRKFWMLETPDKIKLRGNQWGDGQIQIFLEGEEWRGKIRRCEFSESPDDSANRTVTITVTLHWLAHKKVRHWQDANLIDRTSCEWDRILHPYELILALKTVQQTKTKPKKLYFETSKPGENGHFSVRHDPENITWDGEKIIDPSVK